MIYASGHLETKVYELSKLDKGGFISATRNCSKVILPVLRNVWWLNGSRDYKTFFMLNSAQHKFEIAHKYKTYKETQLF